MHCGVLVVIAGIGSHCGVLDPKSIIKNRATKAYIKILITNLRKYILIFTTFIFINFLHIGACMSLGIFV